MRILSLTCSIISLICCCPCKVVTSMSQHIKDVVGSVNNPFRSYRAFLFVIRVLGHDRSECTETNKGGRACVVEILEPCSCLLISFCSCRRENNSRGWVYIHEKSGRSVVGHLENDYRINHIVRQARGSVLSLATFSLLPSDNAALTCGGSNLQKLESGKSRRNSRRHSRRFGRCCYD